MSLRDQLVSNGNWLFRWRSYLPTLLVIPSVLALNELSPARELASGADLWALFCLGISLVGLLVRVLTIGYVPQRTSGRNTKEGQIADTLNTTGIYAVVRHPLYLGNFIIWLGISLFPMHWWLSVIFVLTFWLYYERIILAEEAFLEQKFGEYWRRWARTTPTFIPRLWGWKKPPLPFSFRNVLRREYSGLAGIIICFYLLELYTQVREHDRWEVHPVWSVILLLGVVAYVTLRTLKKKTRLLAIEGR